MAAEGKWLVHGERTIYESPWVVLSVADVTTPSGRRHGHHAVRMPPVALSVALSDDRAHVLMCRRHRFVPDIWNWELPGGVIEPEENPASAAAREMEEETGYRPGRLDHLVTFEPNVGILASPHHVFLARDLELVGDPTEHDEGRFEWIALADVPALISSREIVSSDSLIALLHVLTIPYPP